MKLIFVVHWQDIINIQMTHGSNIPLFLHPLLGDIDKASCKSEWLVGMK